MRFPHAIRAPWADMPFVVAFFLAGVLSTTVGTLVWFAYRAVTEWERSAVQLVEQQSDEMLTLLAIALSRDMKSVHGSVLAPLNESLFESDRQYDLADTFSRAFARFPYPESFFVWRENGSSAGTADFFNRRDRRPPWDDDESADTGFPVVTRKNPTPMAALVQLARQQAAYGQRFGVFETAVAGGRYQVVVHLMYENVRSRRLRGVAGFTVDLDWVQRGYFPDLLMQVAKISGVADGISLEILDGADRIVAATGHGKHHGIVRSNRFPLLFVDPVQILDLPRRFNSDEWTVNVRAADALSLGSGRILWVISLSAGAAVLGLALMLVAVRASTQLAAMKSDFVSSATHELKTPLALIRLASETIAKRRYRTAEALAEYATLLNQQTELLSRLIDNLLTYASLSDVKRRYRFERLDVADIVDEALAHFDARLAATGIEVKMDVSPDLPKISADRQSLLNVFDNIIDNALKYAAGTDVLAFKALGARNGVRVEVADRGVGIPPEERARVFEKFYRGRKVTVPGSGLGLAIAFKVVQDHGGEINVRGHEPTGTIVDVWLPAER